MAVPATYPIDEELIKLCMVNQLFRLGLAEHFVQEAEEVLAQVYRYIYLSFAEEIKSVFSTFLNPLLNITFRNYLNQESREKPSNSVEAQLFKDSLAFRLLRMHGYDVSSGMFTNSSYFLSHVFEYNLTNYSSFAFADSFCWFLHHEDIRDQIENNHEYFSTAMLNVYRATDLMFSGEYDLQEARSFSKKLLEKTTSSNLRRLVIHSFYN
jgi:geranyllinalool synthase